MAKKITWHKINLPIYDTMLQVAFVRSNDELYELALKDGANLDPEDEDDMDGLFYYNKDDHKKIILVQPASNRLIVHETFHAAVHILDDIGQHFDIANHEVHAWLQDYLFDEICNIRG